ncbi:MAG: putative sugar nucleotidyl transferase [Nitrososphaera sp.]
MAGIALFEDSNWRSFSPITLTRATFDIKVGARSFFEEHRQSPEILLTREYLAGITLERHGQCKVNPGSIDEDTIFVNGLLHPGTLSIERLSGIKHTFAITSGQRLLVARLAKKKIDYLMDRVATGKKIDIKALNVGKSTELGLENAQGVVSELWDIISALENSLSMQVSDLGLRNDNAARPGVKIIGRGPVLLEQDAEVEDGTVLDVRNGGVYVGSRAQIAPCRIVGPAYIGGNSQVKQFAIIESSYVGYNCRVAGEIEHSVISDYSNKAHAGFIGHSYVGEWVNVGAMTTTSDLKMTYGNIKMSGAGGKMVDTGLNKVGSFFADMCKTSVGALIYSGRKVGVSSHVHGLAAEDVPSFTIYGTGIGSKNAELHLDSAIETQRKMMSRRSQRMTKAYEQMMREVFSITALERRRSGVRKSKFTI